MTTLPDYKDATVQIEVGRNPSRPYNYMKEIHLGLIITWKENLVWKKKKKEKPLICTYGSKQDSYQQRQLMRIKEDLKRKLKGSQLDAFGP